jgi:hypothetical protein
MCRNNWGVQPRRTDWATVQWGGRDIRSSSNIVFSNGLMDPWHGIGVLESLSDSLVAVIIPEVRRQWGALSLRGGGGEAAGQTDWAAIKQLGGSLRTSSYVVFSKGLMGLWHSVEVVGGFE